MGNPKEACTLLRMPEEDMPLPPQEVPSYFYREEVIIKDNDEDEDEEAVKKARGNGGGTKRPRPTYRWVLEALETKLHGTSSTIKAKDGSAYFILRVDEQTRETRLVPLTEVIMLRQTAPEGEDEEEGGEGGERRKAAKEFIEHGNRFDQRAEAWAKRYGRRLVDVLNVGGGSDSDDEDENGGEGGGRKRRTKRGEKKPWQRTYRVDEDADAGEMDHNPSTKVGTSYQDVLGLMEEEGGRKGGRRGGEEREALAVAFETVDTGGDVPDGADEGFGAPMFGEEFCQPEHRVAARELEEGGGREGELWGEEVMFEEESGIEGYRSSSESEEEEEDEEEGRDGGEEGWKRGKAVQRGPAAFEAAFAGLMKGEEEEGGEGGGEEEGSGEEDDEDQYLGDDDDSSCGSGSEGEERKAGKGKKKEEEKGKKKGG
jgi:hypothetical protein